MATQLDYSRHTSRVFDPPGQNEGDNERFDVECDLCGWIAAADSVEEAQAIARLHEEFVAVLVARFDPGWDSGLEVGTEIAYDIDTEKPGWR